MTKSQNTKNEQLTEQWKKGELIDGKKYYIKFFDSEPFEATFRKAETIFPFLTFEANGRQYRDENGYDCVKVLAPVPSYDEWFKIKNLASLSECLQEKNIECLHRENKLKELLKEVKDYLPEYETPMDILAKIDEVLK